jgi:hypothetical protein
MTLERFVKKYGLTLVYYYPAGLSFGKPEKDHICCCYLRAPDNKGKKIYIRRRGLLSEQKMSVMPRFSYWFTGEMSNNDRLARTHLIQKIRGTHLMYVPRKKKEYRVIEVPKDLE